MSNLTIERENIIEKIRGIDESTPFLEEEMASLKEKRTQLLTEIALRGGNAQNKDITLLEEKIASISSEINDNNDVAANLKLKLCETEKGMRVQEIAQDEAEYVQILDRLSSLPEDINKAFGEVEEAVSDLHFLAQEYWDCKNKRRAFLEKFRSFLDTEKIEAISTRISTATLEEDDNLCKELKHKLSEIIRERNPMGIGTTLRTASPLLVF